jgi:hypothetical protein
MQSCFPPTVPFVPPGFAVIDPGCPHCEVARRFVDGLGLGPDVQRQLKAAFALGRQRTSRGRAENAMGPTRVPGPTGRDSRPWRSRVVTLHNRPTGLDG